MSETTPLLLIHAFKAWTGKTTFNIYNVKSQEGSHGVL
jgi:hypothetical protein